MDDFAPRHEYPESMTQLERICAMARAAGMTYGQYIQKHGDTLPKPKKKSEEDLRKCKTCGEMFLPRVLKDGRLSPGQVNCQKCIGYSFERSHRPKPVPAKCWWCGKEFTRFRKPGKDEVVWCADCRKNRYKILLGEVERP